MELPGALRQGVESALSGVGLAKLGPAWQALSSRYRGEVRDGRRHLSDDPSALAYLATRLPATYAAVRASLDMVAEARPDFAPESALDAGAGPGSAVWAAAGLWPSLRRAVLLEDCPAIRIWGEKLGRDLPCKAEWRSTDLTGALPGIASHDLVLLAYVLDEVAPEARAPLVDRLWELTSDTLVIVEPGTPAGWRRILEARSRLIAAGANIIAPCPHAAACPLVAPDWCHFAQRVARSRLHRLAKSADAPWEDEKFIPIAASRRPGGPVAARVIAPPRSASGRVWLKLCQSDGSAEERLFTRRQGEIFKAARRREWGGSVPGSAAADQPADQIRSPNQSSPGLP